VSAIGPIPVGAAVHTGRAFVGSTSTADAVNDFTALGDVVNTTARLASAAVAGELLVTLDAAGEGNLDPAGHIRRTVEVRGRSESVDILSVRGAGDKARSA
jgi:adenylate cyclase